MIEHRDLEYWKKEIKKYSDKVDDIFCSSKDRVELTKSFLNGLRNFISSVECFVVKKIENKSYESRYSEIDRANKYCKSNSNLNFLSKFYENLNASIGHQDFIGEYAERLGLKYASKLFEVKDFLYKQYNIEVLSNLSLFPFDLDNSFQRYYKEIIKILNKRDLFQNSGEKGTYYVKKKKLIYIDNVLLYEYVFTNALDNNSKFDRFIAFSLLDIPTNYAIKASYLLKEITFFNQLISYVIITGYTIAIRACEIEKLSNIVSVSKSYTHKSGDYNRLMNYMKANKLNLVDIVKFNNDDYKIFNDYVFTTRETIISKTIYESRRIIKSKQTGYKTLIYILYSMNNDILRKQISYNESDSLNNLNLKKGVYAFEKSPFSSGLLEHNPKFRDLIELFDYKEHASEIMARTVINLSNESSCIYIPNERISNSELKDTINHYNSQFQKEVLLPRRILQFGNYTYLSENELDTINVLNFIDGYVNTINFPYYKEYCESRISELELVFSDNDKEYALKSLFEKGSIFAIYGAAGTGKSYFANYVLKVLNDLTKVCIASTNPAVDNMRRKFEDNTAQYMTITKYLKEYDLNSKIDLLIIDECSTICTKEAYDIFNQTKPKLVVLLGDIFQIQSITFGNWFAILRKFLPEKCFVDLKSQFRTESEVLIDFWKEVRNIGANIQEKLSMNEISREFDESIFVKNYQDEIILCLNYDGLYGINNLNKVLQNANKNKTYRWKQYTFKEGDPVIFNDCLKYKDVFYNNLKGTIEKIEEISNGFLFTIKINKVLNPVLCKHCEVELLSIVDKESIVRFAFNKYSEEAYDKDTGYNLSIPFQIAYALSIHKAQGLEYDSVKVLISNEVEEKITHNVFYTAITRARKNLTIYWTPETEKKIVASFKIQNYDNDANILKQRIKLLNTK